MMIETVLGTVFGLLKSVAGLIPGATGDKLKDAAGAVEEVVGKLGKGELSGEQKLALEQAVMEHKSKMEELAVRDAEGGRQVIMTALQSEDAYVRRARPTFLYLSYVILAIVLMVFPVAKVEIAVDSFYAGLINKFFDIFIAAFLGYVVFRSADKSGLVSKVKGLLSK